MVHKSLAPLNSRFNSYKVIREPSLRSILLRKTLKVESQLPIHTKNYEMRDLHHRHDLHQVLLDVDIISNQFL
jgi:hypothetical protein